MRIFIAGCARSGTGVTRDLMRSFADTYIYPQEAPVDAFAQLNVPERNVVVKRTASSYKTLPGLPGAVALVYCVRHPYDVLTSSHPLTVRLRRFHTTPERWAEEYAALQELRRIQPVRQVFVSRYEDLVADPDGLQRRMAEFLRLSPRWQFSQDPKIRISSASVRKWEGNPEFKRYVEGLAPDFLALVRRFCLEFGYDIPPPAPA